MREETVAKIEEVIGFIEANLDGKLELETVAAAVHYSKYHLHRMFADTVGMTVHDYVVRRQLTEAAKLLVFSDRPVMEIALICGYESQQAFTAAFKSMYKLPPAGYRERQVYYPLQLRFSLRRKAGSREPSASWIRLAGPEDIPAWLELVRLVVDGYPYFNEADYLPKLEAAIRKKQALILKDGEAAAGVLVFSGETGSIEFMGVHPQYRNRGIPKLFLDRLMEEYLPGREISITTYREHDKADTGYREELKQLGFAERELLVEFGYPTQKLVLAPGKQEAQKEGDVPGKQEVSVYG